MTIDREKFTKVFEEEMTSEDLLTSYTVPAGEFLTKIKNNKGMLYGLIGEYGTGKSSFLNAVRKVDETKERQDNEKPNIRITFEAWKYPDRKEIRDAFIIEILSQIIKKINGENMSTFSIMNKIKRELKYGIYNKDDNIKNKISNFLRKIKERTKFTIILSFIIGILILRKSEILSNILGWMGTIGGIITFILALLPELINALSQGVESIIGSTITESKEGASRLFDYEYFFEQYRTRIIETHYKEFGRVYIIIEDIDRCDRDGMIFIETLSYFISQISSKGRMEDKLMCIVSVGNQFLQDNRHLINKAITNYSFFEMKVDSILEYFSKKFNGIGIDDNTIGILIRFVKYYLETDGTKRTIREIKYLFRKITPLMQKKGEEVGATDEVILGMILFNFSLFIRSNRTKNPNKESLDSIKPLIYLKWIKSVQALGNEYYSNPANRQIIDYSFLEQPTQASIILENHNNLSIYYKLFGEETRNININSIFCFENNKIIEDSEHKNPDNSEVLKHGFLRDEREVRDQNGGLIPHYIYLFSPHRLLNE